MDCRAFAHGHAGLCEPVVIPAAKGNMTISRTDPFRSAPVLGRSNVKPPANEG
jgi:hypothetical protein